MERLRHDRQGVRHIARRVGLTVVGFALVIAGLPLLVLPGPGILLIVTGLALMAPEVPWARRILDKLRVIGKRIMAFVGALLGRLPRRPRTRPT